MSKEPSILEPEKMKSTKEGAESFKPSTVLVCDHIEVYEACIQNLNEPHLRTPEAVNILR